MDVLVFMQIRVARMIAEGDRPRYLFRSYKRAQQFAHARGSKYGRMFTSIGHACRCMVIWIAEVKRWVVVFDTTELVLRKDFVGGDISIIEQEGFPTY